MGDDPIFEVINLNTWPKIDDILREPAFSRLSLFRRPSSEMSISEYLHLQSVDKVETSFVGSIECPYYVSVLEIAQNEILPFAQEMRDYVERYEPFPDEAHSRFQKLLDSIPQEAYQHPEGSVLAEETKEKLTAYFNDSDKQNTLFIIMKVAYDEMKTTFSDWFDETFPEEDRLHVPDVLKLVSKANSQWLRLFSRVS